ncbi:MAG TPA: hypothetical protein VGC54_08360 [Planctomycetota bacterium]
MRNPPLLDWVVEQFQASPVLTVVVGLVVLGVALFLLKHAIRLFLLLIVIGLIAVVASYLVRGEDDTNDTLKDLGRKVKEEMEDRGILEDDLVPGGAKADGLVPKDGKGAPDGG